ncbi:MAG: SAM-dependent methyltransferase [Oxalobacteraceae bacterium]|jgi:16S rRNA (cytidine1402-2'-O)-methyltransferase|nr:SAM-dependent methyltransferase [Oxalobacteraceae bacterium]
MNGTLYLIPNSLGPGALDDVLPDSVRHTTAQLDYFIAENAKTARAFLKLVALTHTLNKPLQEIEIRELNVKTAASELPSLLAPLLAGRNAGLVSEAGVPAVADPGADLVRLAHQKNIRVKPLVGPSSILLALMASGLNGQSFAFHGYLPTDAGLRANRLRQLEQRSRQENQTQIFIETPYRNEAMIEAIATHCTGTTLVSLATDLTLETETVRTQSVHLWKNEITAGRFPDFRKKPTVFLLLAS